MRGCAPASFWHDLRQTTESTDYGNSTALLSSPFEVSHIAFAFGRPRVADQIWLHVLSSLEVLPALVAHGVWSQTAVVFSSNYVSSQTVFVILRRAPTGLQEYCATDHNQGLLLCHRRNIQIQALAPIVDLRQNVFKSQREIDNHVRYTLVIASAASSARLDELPFHGT